MTVLDFFPYNKPSGSGKISLPDCNIEIYTRDTSSTYIEKYVKTEPKFEFNIDLEKLKATKSKDNYSLKEIKEMTRMSVKGSTTLRSDAGVQKAYGNTKQAVSKGS